MISVYAESSGVARVRAIGRLPMGFFETVTITQCFRSYFPKCFFKKRPFLIVAHTVQNIWAAELPTIPKFLAAPLAERKVYVKVE